MFSINKEALSGAKFQAKGFSLQFTNGYTLSVQFGIMNYCERNCKIADWLDADSVKSKDAEIAVIRDNSLIQLSEHDQVIGWVSAETVGILAGFLAKLTKADESTDAVIFDFVQSMVVSDANV